MEPAIGACWSRFIEKKYSRRLLLIAMSLDGETTLPRLLRQLSQTL
jgi:hypothetical protein